MGKQMNATGLRCAVSLLAVTMGTLLHTQAIAAAAEQPSNVTPLAEPIDEEILVTARRTAERLQATPVSVTAFSAETLRESNIRSTIDLMIKTPGVYLGGSGGRENSVFQIRGQSKARSGFNAPAVLSYFADVPMPTFGSGVPTFDLASVQILKGPQGTLFGRNTTGGAVLFYPVLPSYKLEGYVEAGYGSYDDRQLEGALTVPIIDGAVALRLAGQYNKRDGYTRDITHNVMQDGANVRAFRGSLLIEPTSFIKNVTTLDYYENEYNGDSVVVTKVRAVAPLLDPIAGAHAAADAALARQQARGIREVESDMRPYNRTVRKGLTNRTDIDLGSGVSLVNILGYRRNFIGYNINTDGLGGLPTTGFGPVPAGTVFNSLNSGARIRIEQWTDELQLKGGLYDGKLNWLLGAFYLHSNPYGPTGTGSKALSAAPESQDFNSFGYTFLTEDSRALFANANLELVEGLKLDVGIRYTWDKARACTASSSSTTVVQGNIGPEACTSHSDPALLGASTNNLRSAAPTYQASLEYQVTPDLFAYVVTRRGYRAGSINSPTLGGTLAQYQSFKPESVNDIEGGFRSDWNLGSDVRVRFNASAFIGWYKDVSFSLSGVRTRAGCIVGDPVFGAPPFSPDGDCITTNDPASGALSINAGKTRVRGLDVDGFIALGRQFKFTFAGNLLDPKSTSVSVPAGLAVYVPINATIGFDFVAKHTYSLGAEFNTTLGSAGEFSAHADFYHSGPTSFVDVRFPGYSIVNARLELNQVGGMPIDLSVFATNLFNKEYIQMGAFNGPNAGVEASIFGPPRQVGASVRYRFGN